MEKNSQNKKKIITCELCHKKIQETSIKTHLIWKHDINVIWFPCKSCDKKCKSRGVLKKHLSDVHNIGVVLHLCDIDGCHFSSKSRDGIRKHKQDVHLINVTWYSCNIKGCDYRCKSKSKIKRHKINVHRIGVRWYKCHICKEKYRYKSSLKRHVRRKHLKRNLANDDIEPPVKKQRKTVNLWKK